MLARDLEIFLKKKKKISVNMVVNDINFFQRKKNKGQLSIQKISLEWKHKYWLSIKHFYNLPQITPQNKFCLNFYFIDQSLEYEKILKCWTIYECKIIDYYKNCF